MEEPEVDYSEVVREPGSRPRRQSANVTASNKITEMASMRIKTELMKQKYLEEKHELEMQILSLQLKFEERRLESQA